MDDPMTRSRLGRVTGTRPFWGLSIPSEGPRYFLGLFSRNLPYNRNPRLAQNVLDDRLSQS